MLRISPKLALALMIQWGYHSECGHTIRAEFYRTILRHTN